MPGNDPFLSALEASGEPPGPPLYEGDCTHRAADGCNIVVDSVHYQSGMPEIEVWLHCQTCGATCHIDQDAPGLLCILDDAGQADDLYWEIL